MLSQRWTAAAKGWSAARWPPLAASAATTRPLAAAIANTPPIRSNWLKRTLYRLRQVRSFSTLIYLELPTTDGTDHCVCRQNSVIPSMVDLKVGVEPAHKRTRRPHNRH